MENAIKNKTKDKKTFAKGLCFAKYFWVYVIGCIFGCYWEEILSFTTNFLENGTFIWELHRGVIYGPFSPVYGGGAMLLTYVFAKKDFKWWQYILYGALGGGFFEYLISFLQETFIGTVSWDYSEMFLNINGRTTVPFMLFWGLLACIWAMYIYPKMSKFIESWPYKFGKILTTICVILLSLDMLISWTALFRQTQRRQGIPPKTIVGELYDKYYTDEFLKKYFVNMRES